MMVRYDNMGVWYVLRNFSALRQHIPLRMADCYEVKWTDTEKLQRLWCHPEFPCPEWFESNPLMNMPRSWSHPLVYGYPVEEVSLSSRPIELKMLACMSHLLRGGMLSAKKESQFANCDFVVYWNHCEAIPELKPTLSDGEVVSNLTFGDFCAILGTWGKTI